MKDRRIIPVGAELPAMENSPARQREPQRSRKGNHKQTKGRFECINTFLDSSMADLPPAERSVWLLLWRDTKPNGLAIASQGSLAARAGVSERAVRSAVKRLGAKGLLTVHRRGGLRQGASVYRVHPLAISNINRKLASGY